MLPEAWRATGWAVVAFLAREGDRSLDKLVLHPWHACERCGTHDMQNHTIRAAIKQKNSTVCRRYKVSASNTALIDGKQYCPNRWQKLTSSRVDVLIVHYVLIAIDRRMPHIRRLEDRVPFRVGLLSESCVCNRGRSLPVETLRRNLPLQGQ
jgi:hypothetical protein